MGVTDLLMTIMMNFVSKPLRAHVDEFIVHPLLLTVCITFLCVSCFGLYGTLKVPCIGVWIVNTLGPGVICTCRPTVPALKSTEFMDSSSTASSTEHYESSDSDES